eukprot:g10.t1
MSATQGKNDLPKRNAGLKHLGRAWDFYRETLGSPKYFAAPMVNQSELPYRMLVRKYNTDVAFTPMFHARIFSESKKYRASNFQTNDADRPLIVQFCGNDPEILLSACKLVQDQCDAVDLNLGCPQGIAHRGRYGAFLLGETDLLCKIVSTLHNNLKIPVTCKIRLLPRLEDTLKLVLALEAAGCHMLTVHGRTKEEKHNKTNVCNWEAIATIKKVLQIPVVANGGIATINDVHRCMETTGVDGVMSSEALLENPSLFEQVNLLKRTENKKDNAVFMPLHERQLHLAEEYMQLVKLYPTARSNIRAHLNKFFFSVFSAFGDKIEVQEARSKLNNPDKHTWFKDYLDLISFLRRFIRGATVGGEKVNLGTKDWNPPAEGIESWAHPGKWYVRHRENTKKRKNGVETIAQKRKRVEFSIHQFKAVLADDSRLIMVFLIAGLENHVRKEIVAKLDDVNDEDIERVGHFDFPVGYTGGQTELRKLLFATSASFDVLQSLRTVQSFFVFVTAGHGLPSDKAAALPLLKSAISSTIDVAAAGSSNSRLQRAYSTWCNFFPTLDKSTASLENIKFRASCIRSGKHKYNSYDVSCAIGDAVISSGLSNFEVSLKEYDMEVFSIVMQSSFVVGISLPCGKEARIGAKPSGNLPRESRPFVPFKRPESTLRPSTAHLMMAIANTLPGDLVLDPMCGAGTIPIESSIMHGALGEGPFSIGGDISESCMDLCTKNSITLFVIVKN